MDHSGIFTIIIVGGRDWNFVKRVNEYQVWTSDYWCPDGDGVLLYIGDMYFELSCFSGIGSSVIKMQDIDFAYMQDKVKDLDLRAPFEIQAIKVADYFCRIFCQYSDVSDFTIANSKEAIIDERSEQVKKNC